MMKKIICMLAISLSFASFKANAFEEVGTTIAVASTAIASYFSVRYIVCGPTPVCHQAHKIIQEALDYNQSGEVGMLLNQKIKELQAVDESLSNEAAIDALILNSRSLLGQ